MSFSVIPFLILCLLLTRAELSFAQDHVQKNGPTKPVLFGHLANPTTSPLSPPEVEVLFQAQIRVESLLPKKMLLALQQHRPQQGYQIFVELYDPHIAGFSNSKGQIKIQKNLLKTPQQLAQTLIHEWSHLYDYLGLHSDEELVLRRDCVFEQNSFPEGSQNKFLNEKCDLIKSLSTTVSSRADFLEVSGWALAIYGHGNRLKETAFDLRSPRQYETTNPLEMFAVNMEHFLLDPEYQCRRPTLFRLLANHFNESPFATTKCPNILQVIDPAYADASNAFFKIDPERVYQIHYLLADRGSDITSLFGHSMIRLVICAPERKTVGPECLKDVRHHLVLSFRAFADTPEISSASGLTGKYPSRLFFIPLTQIISEYNKSNLRGLASYPLDLTPTEILHVLQRAVEIHWSYNAKYFFLSNNCTIETMNLLRSSLLHENLMTVSAQTPFTLRNLLMQKRLIKEYNLPGDLSGQQTNLDEAIKSGYYFASYQEHYNKALEIIRAQIGSLAATDAISDTTGNPTTSTMTWLKLNPTVRREIFKTHLPTQPAKRSQYAAAFHILESLAESNQYVVLEDLILKLENSDQTSKELATKISSLLESIANLEAGLIDFKGQLTTPSQLLKPLNGGYGIPTPEELNSMTSTLAALGQAKRQNKSAIAAQQNQLKDLLSEQLLSDNKNDDLKAILENKTLFIHALKN